MGLVYRISMIKRWQDQGQDLLQAGTTQYATIQLFNTQILITNLYRWKRHQLMSRRQPETISKIIIEALLQKLRLF